MERPSAVEQERIDHINNLMDRLHKANAVIYEGLMDRDFTNLPFVIGMQIELLQEISNSLQDSTLR